MTPLRRPGTPEMTAMPTCIRRRQAELDHTELRNIRSRPAPRRAQAVRRQQIPLRNCWARAGFACALRDCYQQGMKTRTGRVPDVVEERRRSRRPERMPLKQRQHRRGSRQRAPRCAAGQLQRIAGRWNLEQPKEWPEDEGEVGGIVGRVGRGAAHGDHHGCGIDEWRAGGAVRNARFQPVKL
jgi:hypothetical protein